MRGYIRSERIGPAERMATCQCGAAYGDDGDGQAAHQVVHGHRPVEKPYIDGTPGIHHLTQIPNEDDR